MELTIKILMYIQSSFACERENFFSTVNVG